MQEAIHATIRGIVIPDAWDDLGNVVTVAVFTFQEEKIRIINDPLGSALKHHLRQQVILDGEVVSQGLFPAIRVRHYRVEQGSSEPGKR